MVDRPKIDTEKFWDKLFTKKWLAENTTLKTPKTFLGSASFKEILTRIGELPVGSYALKSLTGRQSIGVFFFHKTFDGYQIGTHKDVLDLDTAIDKLKKVKRKRRVDTRQPYDCKFWFVEELIKPHERFEPYTDCLDYPPIIRLCGRPTIHFIGMSTMRDLATGISGAAWQKRRYVWLDLQGVVRDTSEMNLDNVDRHSQRVALKKAAINVPIGSKIGGIIEIVNQLNTEIVPKIQLHQRGTWSCDGIFNTQNEFVVIELNHNAGLRFEGFSW